jgi:subtilisin family serine protease
MIILLILFSTLTFQTQFVIMAKPDDDDDDDDHDDDNSVSSLKGNKNSDHASNALVEILNRNPDCVQSKVQSISSSDHGGSDDDDDEDAIKAIDSDFETTWSAEQFGSYLQLDLGAVKRLCSVDINWFDGDQRENNFVLSVSENGSAFKDVLRDSSSGTTQTKEYYEFPPADGRYLRITFYGNSENEKDVGVREVVVNTMRADIITSTTTTANLAGISGSEAAAAPSSSSPPTNSGLPSFARNDTNINNNNSNINSAPAVSDIHAWVSSAASFEITLSATDSDPNDQIIYHIIQLPAHGNLTASTTQATVRYTPDEGFSGFDKFTYKVFDSHDLESNESTVFLDVNDRNENRNHPSPSGSVQEFPVAGDAIPESQAARLDQHHQQINSNRDQIRGQYIVVLKPNSTTAAEAAVDISPQSENLRLKAADEVRAMAEESRSRGAEILNIYQHALRGYVIRTPVNENENEDVNTTLVEELRRDPRVALVEPDQRVSMFEQSIPLGVNRVDGELSSAFSSGGMGAPSVDADIAILDTGIDLTHPDLNVYNEKSFVLGTSSADDDNGHGTHVAGIAAAKDNDIGVVGMAPGARLWAVKVLDSSGSGSISDIIAGIDYVTEHANEIDVVNLSFGCECNSPALDKAVNNAVGSGITFVVAAGNGNKDVSMFSPANNPDVITVSAIADSDGKCGAMGASTKYGDDDTFASFSNYGSSVDIAAPGVGILSTYKDGKYATLSGTSMASPHVAGAAALFSSAHNGSSPAEIRSALIDSGSTSLTKCDGYGHGYFTGDPGSGEHEPLLYARDL